MPLLLPKSEPRGVVGTLGAQHPAWAYHLAQRRRRRASSGAPPAPVAITAPAAFWRLEEASGTRFDSVGAAHFTANNNPGSTTGKNGTAANFVAANIEYLSQPERAWLQTPAATPMTFSLWFRPGADEIGTLLWRDGGAFYVGQSGLVEGGVYFQMWCENAQNWEYEWSGNVGGGTYLPGEWNFVCFQFDYANQVVRIGVKPESEPGGVAMGAYAVSAPPENFPGPDSADLLIGHYDNSIPLNSPVDSVGYWPSTLLTQTEIDLLFNGGNGREYYAGAWH